MDAKELLYENWPGQFDSFSHLEFACAIPQVLFLISFYARCIHKCFNRILTTAI